MLDTHAGLEEVGTHMEAGGQAVRERLTLPSWILIAVSRRPIKRRKTVGFYVDSNTHVPPRVCGKSGGGLSLSNGGQRTQQGFGGGNCTGTSLSPPQIRISTPTR